MTILLENPWPAILVGIVVEAILGVILVRTGRGAVLVAMGGVLVVVLALVGLEWLVVTERERVELAIEAGRAALEANDPDAVLACLAPQANSTEDLLRRVLQHIEFTSVRISRLEVGQINELTSPPSVRVQLGVRVEFRDRRGIIPYRHYTTDLELMLRRYDDRWLVTDHRWEDERYARP